MSCTETTLLAKRQPIPKSVCYEEGELTFSKLALLRCYLYFAMKTNMHACTCSLIQHNKQLWLAAFECDHCLPPKLHCICLALKYGADHGCAGKCCHYGGACLYQRLLLFSKIKLASPCNCFENTVQSMACMKWALISGTCSKFCSWSTGIMLIRDTVIFFDSPT